jgi:hypothetical protein
VGELRSLRVGDFDLERGLVSSNQTVWRRKFQSTKSDNATPGNLLETNSFRVAENSHRIPFFISGKPDCEPQLAHSVYEEAGLYAALSFGVARQDRGIRRAPAGRVLLPGLSNHCRLRSVLQSPWRHGEFEPM